MFYYFLFWQVIGKNSDNNKITRCIVIGDYAKDYYLKDMNCFFCSQKLYFFQYQSAAMGTVTTLKKIVTHLVPSGPVINF